MERRSPLDMSSDPPDKSLYSAHWDHYVEVDWDVARGDREDLRWPGDEWGDPALWERFYQTLFAGPGAVETWERAVEIGQGSGKYTLKVLANPGVQVRAYDVSSRFLEVCRRRCEQEIAEGRLSLHHLDATLPDHLLSDLTACGWRRKVDAVYSIDAMVHVDLQYMIAYLITAAAVLREGGKLVLTLASPTTDGGFQLLLEGIHHFWNAQGSSRGSGKMEWVSAAIMESLLRRLGFQIDLLDQPDEWPILQLVASLEDPQAGEALLPHIASAAGDAAG